MLDRHIPQALTLFLSVAGIGFWMSWARQHWDKWLYAVPPLTWLLHVTLFYSAVFGRDLGVLTIGPIFSEWSAVLRLHSVILVAGIGLVLYLERLSIRA